MQVPMVLPRRLPNLSQSHHCRYMQVILHSVLLIRRRLFSLDSSRPIQFDVHTNVLLILLLLLHTSSACPIDKNMLLIAICLSLFIDAVDPARAKQPTGVYKLLLGGEALGSHNFDRACSWLSTFMIKMMGVLTFFVCREENDEFEKDRLRLYF